MADEPQERFELRKSLMILNWALDADATQHRFDLQLLENHNIHVQPMSLEKGSADNPRFFAPYANMPPVTHEILGEAEKDPPVFIDGCIKDQYSRRFHDLWHDYAYHGMHCDDSGAQKRDWPWIRGCVRLYHALLCKGLPLTPNCEASSQPEEVERCADPKLPHIKAAITVNAEAKDGEFLRAEILSVLRLIIHQMRQKRLIPHMKIPVQLMVLSILASRARLIEAFCIDGKIVLRATKLYHLPKEIAIASQDFAEWYNGVPTGDTS